MLVDLTSALKYFVLLVFMVLMTSLGSVVVEISSSFAQQNRWGGGARGTAARVIGQRWKIASTQANIFSGPSSAYSQRGRLYQGEESPRKGGRS